MGAFYRVHLNYVNSHFFINQIINLVRAFGGFPLGSGDFNRCDFCYFCKNQMLPFLSLSNPLYKCLLLLLNIVSFLFFWDQFF